MLKIVRLIVSLAVITLFTACATITPPLTDDKTKNLRNGKSVVIFSDPNHQINYLEDIYMVLAVSQEASTSSYNGIWNSEKDLAAIHTEELSKIGLDVTSIHDSMSSTDITEFKPLLDELDSLSKSQSSGGFGFNKSGDTENGVHKKINNKLRLKLKEKGYDYLFWISSPGLTLHLKALGLPPWQYFNHTYRVYDLSRNELVWGSPLGILYTDVEKIPEGQTGKQFLESNNLAGLKRDTKKIIREYYNMKDKSKRISYLIGLEKITKTAPAN